MARYNVTAFLVPIQGGKSQYIFSIEADSIEGAESQIDLSGPFVRIPFEKSVVHVAVSQIRHIDIMPGSDTESTGHAVGGVRR